LIALAIANVETTALNGQAAAYRKTVERLVADRDRP
jgi:hypothetical protein